MGYTRSAIRSDWLVDMGTVILISLAAIATAWCGYQATRWSALQALDYSRANSSRVEASIAASRSNALRMIDVGLFVQYESAVFSRNDALAAFLLHRFRPEFRRALDAWYATKPKTSAQAPLSPFAMRQYHLASDDEYAALFRRADDWMTQAVAANETSDRYVFLTVLFASVTFLGGVAMKTRYPWNTALTAVGAALLIYSLLRVMEFPVR